MTVLISIMVFGVANFVLSYFLQRKRRDNADGESIPEEKTVLVEELERAYMSGIVSPRLLYIGDHHWLRIEQITKGPIAFERLAVKLDYIKDMNDKYGKAKEIL